MTVDYIYSITLLQVGFKDPVVVSFAIVTFLEQQGDVGSLPLPELDRDHVMSEG